MSVPRRAILGVLGVVAVASAVYAVWSGQRDTPAVDAAASDASARAPQKRTRCGDGIGEDERAAWHPQRRELDAITLEELATHDDAEMSEEIDARLFDKLHTAGYARFTRVEQNVYLAVTLDAELSSGGFAQFFAGSSGNCAVRTAAALKDMGDARMIDLYARALAVFPGGSPSEDLAERGAQIDALPNREGAWRGLDDEYYRGDAADAHVSRYIRANLRGFDLPPR